MQPVGNTPLENAYVILTPLDPSHQAALHKAVIQTSHSLWAYMMKDALADFAGWWDNLIAMHAAAKQHVYVVTDKGTGHVVGCSSLMNIEIVHDRLEIGNTWYVPAAQRSYINPACKSLLMAYAFETLGVHRLEMKCDALNKRSAGAMRKLGASEEGLLRGHMKVPDHKGGMRYRDTIYFSILVSQWHAIKQQLEQRLMLF